MRVPPQKKIRKLFRRKLADTLEWYHKLRKNAIFQKIMATANDLQDGPVDYDREEAIKISKSGSAGFC